MTEHALWRFAWTRVRRRGRRAARLPARGERAEAGQRLAGPPFRRHRATRTSWPAPPRLAGRWRARARARSARPCASPSRRPPRWTRSNTNLGIVLLLAPLARAAPSLDADVGQCDRPPRCACVGVLDDDHRRRRARRVRGDSPRGARRARTRGRAGCRGRADRDAARRDAARRRTATAIAREYATAFEITFETGAPALARARARRPLLGRRGRRDVSARCSPPRRTRTSPAAPAQSLAAEVSREAQSALAAGGVRSISGPHAIDDMDRTLRCATPGNLANPGTTADLTAAAIFVVLLGGGWTACGHVPERGIAMQRRGEFRVSVSEGLSRLRVGALHHVRRATGAKGFTATTTGRASRSKGRSTRKAGSSSTSSTLKKIMRRLCDEIDHKVLLPLENPKIQVARGRRVGDGRRTKASRATSFRGATARCCRSRTRRSRCSPNC